MKLKEIIDLLKDISIAHPDINSFHTGLNFEHNDSNINYPALRLIFPYDLKYKQENRVMEYTFNMTLFVNDLKEEILDSTKLVNTNYMIQDSQLNEVELKDENKLRDRALGIMNNVLQTLIQYERCEDYFEVTDYKIKALERANNDFVTGVRLTITVRTDNTYRCEFPNLIDCNGNNIYDTTNPCPQLEIPEPIRYSQQFNGVNQYGQVSQQNNNIFDIDWRNPFSFECWINYTPGETSYILNKINPAAGYFLATIGSRDVLRFQIRNTSPFQIIDVNSVDTLITGWNHCIITYNGGGGAEQDVTFHINSVESPKPNNWSQGSQLTNGTTATSALLEVQRISAFGVHGKGTLCNVRAWRNVELNSQEISTLYNNGKVLYENIPQESSLMFDTGFMDENKSWLGQGWIMQELTGTSNLIYGSGSTFVDRIDDRP